MPADSCHSRPELGNGEKLHLPCNPQPHPDHVWFTLVFLNVLIRKAYWDECRDANPPTFGGIFPLLRRDPALPAFSTAARASDQIVAVVALLLIFPSPHPSWTDNSDAPADRYGWEIVVLLLSNLHCHCSSKSQWRMSYNHAMTITIWCDG